MKKLEEEYPQRKEAFETIKGVAGFKAQTVDAFVLCNVLIGIIQALIYIGDVLLYSLNKEK